MRRTVSNCQVLADWMCVRRGRRPDAVGALLGQPITGEASAVAATVELTRLVLGMIGPSGCIFVIGMTCEGSSQAARHSEHQSPSPGASVGPLLRH